MTEITDTIRIDGPFDQKVLGIYDSNLKRIKKKYKVSLTTRGSEISVSGQKADVRNAVDALNAFIRRVDRGQDVSEAFTQAVLSRSTDGTDRFLTSLDIFPRTKGQRKYLKTISEHDITFAIGPAGTGKTYLAVACAVDALNRGEVRKIVLVRPAVEAGESLGFLPGDLREKINPYLMPIYDALYDMVDYEKARSYIERGIIEIIPIAFMRGRTFHDAFVIMDEGQNSTKSQMLMFLTRMGVGSRVVVTGDITQTDLPYGQPSGLQSAQQILRKIKGIGFSELDAEDIVRHSLVKEIVRVFTHDQGKEGKHHE